MKRLVCLDDVNVVTLTAKFSGTKTKWDYKKITFLFQLIKVNKKLKIFRRKEAITLTFLTSQSLLKKEIKHIRIFLYITRWSRNSWAFENVY